MMSIKVKKPTAVAPTGSNYRLVVKGRKVFTENDIVCGNLITVGEQAFIIPDEQFLPLEKHLYHCEVSVTAYRVGPESLVGEFVQ